MADNKQLFTHEQDLGPGVVRTPGYVVEDAPALNGISDRRIDKDGNAAEHPILSTYDGTVSPHVSVTADFKPETPSPAEAVAALPSKAAPAAQSSAK